MVNIQLLSLLFTILFCIITNSISRNCYTFIYKYGIIVI